MTSPFPSVEAALAAGDKVAAAIRESFDRAAEIRQCNHIEPNSWHTHQPDKDCPTTPPVQLHCSPSLSVLGQCRCPKHLLWARFPSLRPVYVPPPSRQGPMRLDDAVGATCGDDCEDCNRRRREVDVSPYTWTGLGPLD